MNILERIVENKQLEIALAKKTVSLEQLKDLPYFSRESLSLRDSVKNRSGIIAEFKRKSPSKGPINKTSDPVEVAAAYEQFGASGISVLTDEKFFGGSLLDLSAVRAQSAIPLLRKDFMMDEYQFYEAKAMGADVVLLIAACLSPAQVQEFTALAHKLKLEVLLEIHTEEELQHFNPKIDFVGINNRNLKDFKVDLNHSITLKNSLPANVISIAESGIYSVEDFIFLKEKGFDGFLMGEFFMKNANPGAAFGEFVKNIGL